VLCCAVLCCAVLSNDVLVVLPTPLCYVMSCPNAMSSLCRAVLLSCPACSKLVLKEKGIAGFYKGWGSYTLLACKPAIQ
jgi:hypothetical protein